MSTSVPPPLIPQIGFGTYRLGGRVLADELLPAAIAAGYRSIDSAQVYRNETVIGDYLAVEFANGTLTRQDIFITTKIAPANQGAGRCRDSVLASLARFRLDCLDLVLIHWPGAAGQQPSSPKNAQRRKETWLDLEALVREGKIRHIGVSNYTIPHLTELLAFATIRPVVNQFEMHPLWPEHDLVSFCHTQNIIPQAYSSLGEGNLVNPATLKQLGLHDVFTDITHRHKNSTNSSNITIAQMLLRWALQKRVHVIPKASSAERMKENISVLDFELDEDAIRVLDTLTTTGGLAPTKYCWDPKVVA